MDVGEYETNTLAITNIASITFRVYRHVASPTTSLFPFSPSDVERALRNDGHLVFSDSRRQGFWCFRLLRKDGSAFGSPPRSSLQTTIDVGPYKLTTVEEGAFEPNSLVKGRPAVPNPLNTPNSSSSSSAQSAADSTVRNTGTVQQSAGVAALGSNQTLSQTTAMSGGAPDHESSQNSNGAQAQVHGTSETRSFPPVPVKVVYNFFISAVLASLSSAYCSRAKAIALNNRTFLLPPLDPLWDGQESSRADSKSLVATLKVTLTTAGALLVSLSHSVLRGMGCSEWACYAGIPPPGSSVLAAPWGKFATVRGVYPPLLSAEATSHHLERAKKSLTLPSVPPVWKSFAAKMLEMRGTSASVFDESSWLRVEFLLGDEATGSKPVVILWPSVLCFWSLESSAITSAPYSRLDPLTNLREAFLEQLRVEEAAFRPKDDAMEEDVAMEDMPTVSSFGKGTFSDGPSPLGIRYPLTATGTVYPTPPDGVLNPVGATPTFDGSASSPGNAASTSVPTDLDTVVAETGGTDDAFGDFWTGNEPRQEDQDQVYMGEPDSLFGDIGADMFGDDVTDADFNFFDDKQPDRMHPIALSVPPISDKMEVEPESRSDGTPADARMDLDVHHYLSTTPGELYDSPHMPAELPPPPPSQPSFEDPITETSSSKHDKTPGSPVFTKPELRHARSNLVDANAKSIKRPPSPFNAMTVYKRVRAIVEANKAKPGSSLQPSSGRRGNLFEGLRFTDFMIQNNKKYEQNGKFGFRWPQPRADMVSDLSSATSPTTFRRPAKKRPELSDTSPEFATLISSITRGLKSSSLQPHSPLRLEDSGGASSDSSSVDSSSDDSDDNEPLAASMAQRKLRARVVAKTVPSPEAATELSRAYSEGVWDFPIARFFAEPMPPSTELNYNDEDIVDVAQIVTQQITRATIRSSFDEDSGHDLQKSKLRQTLLQRIRYSVATLQDALPACLDEAFRCSLKPYLEVQDFPLLMQPSRLQPRPAPGSEQLRNNLFAVPTPFVGIRRNDSALSILPTAIEFWEVLGLEPLHGTKDIRAVCMYPNYEGLSEEVGGFLSRMRIVYESLRLGSHENLPAKANVIDGMVSFDVSYTANYGQSTSRPEFPGVEQVHKLAQALAAEDTPGKSLVVYLVYCAEMTTGIVDACLAFQRLSQLYEIAVTSRNSEPNDLVLQLIPSDFLASQTSLAVPTPIDMLRLSLEVYDRCASPRGPKPSPSFLLEQPPSRLLELKLSPTPSVDVQRENSCIQVAYAYSADGRWVTAAWTDNSGWRQFSSAYWVGRKDMESSNSFAMVAREIWTNTCAIVSNLRVHWRAIISKCSPMEQEEIDIWLELAKAETRASMSLTLVTVDTQPTLELLPPIVTVPPTILSQFSAATPAPTPQASVFSPEQTGHPVTPAGSFANPSTPAGTPVGAPTPATPSGSTSALGGAAPNSPALPNTPGANTNNDAGAKLAAAGADPSTVSEIDGNVSLVDIADNTWIAVASHRLNTSMTWVDLSHALVSGYLIKRGGIGRDDAPVVLEVNVVRAEGNPRVYEALIRDILTAYRSLGTLARTRGILDGERDVRPWHVAAAERSAQALCKWM